MKKILYVEDDLDIANSVKIYLENKGFLVSLFTNIEEAKKV